MKSPPFLQLRIELNQVRPVIWRRILVWSDTSLDELHLIVQGAMGWEDRHLHHFRQGQRMFVPEEELDQIQWDAEDESLATVGDLLRRKGSTLEYVYDYGDDWQHTIRLEKKTRDPRDPDWKLPRILDGANACPPEDCGGLFRYPDLVQSFQAKEPGTLAWMSACGLEDDWKPDAYSVEAAQEDLDALISKEDDAWEDFDPEDEDEAGDWSPLEEQLARTGLDNFLQEPEWRELLVHAAEIMSLPLQTAADPAPAPQELIPEFDTLVRDHVAFDMILEGTKPAGQVFADAHDELPEGAIHYLEAMLGSVFSPYLVLSKTEDGEISLVDLAQADALTARFSTGTTVAHQKVEFGSMLFARVIRKGEEWIILDPHLGCAFDREDFEGHLKTLAGQFDLDPGNASDLFALFKASAPHWLGYWAVQSMALNDQALPVSLLPGEEWNPGVGSYRVPDLPTVARALNRCPGLEQLHDTAWFFPGPDRQTDQEDSGCHPPMGWVMAQGPELFLLAGSKKTMALLRAAVKQAGIQPLRHLSTRYGLADQLPLVLAPPVET